MPKSTIARRAPERATTPDIEAAIASWQPKGLDPDGWSAVEDFVRDAVRRLQPRTPKAARWQLWVVARFVVWAHSVGVPLELEHQFSPEVVHRYCEVALQGSPGTRRTVRHQLILFGRNLTVTAPEDLERLTRAAIEVVALFRPLQALQVAVDEHPGPATRVRLRALLVGLVVHGALERENSITAVARTLRTLPPTLRRALALERQGSLVTATDVELCWHRLCSTAGVLAPTTMGPWAPESRSIDWVTGRLLELPRPRS